MATDHRYAATTRWAGSTKNGYAEYSRNHHTHTTPATTDLPVTADTPFGGDPGIHNPEQLLLIAASSCQMLSFLALAARKGIDVRHYTDDATAVMPKAGVDTKITHITLSPRITVAAVPDRTPPADDELHHYVQQAHHGCFIANTLNCDMTINPTFTWCE